MTSAGDDIRRERGRTDRAAPAPVREDAGARGGPADRHAARPPTPARPAPGADGLVVDTGAAAIFFQRESELVPISLDQIPPIGPFHAAKLAALNIRTTDDLLNLCRHAEGRRVVSETTGLDVGKLLSWARLADLMQVHGVTPAYAQLLLASGVTSALDLRGRSPLRLADRMMELNTAAGLAAVVPPAAVISGWIEQAQRVESKVTE